jgi:hypothetical protein
MLGRYVKIDITSNWGDATYIKEDSIFFCNSSGVKWNDGTMVHTTNSDPLSTKADVSDASLGNCWYAYVSALPVWLTIDLGVQRDISKIKLQANAGEAAQGIKDFTISISDDGTNWTELLSGQTLNNADEQIFSYVNEKTIDSNLSVSPQMSGAIRDIVGNINGALAFSPQLLGLLNSNRKYLDGTFSFLPALSAYLTIPTKVLLNGTLSFSPTMSAYVKTIATVYGAVAVVLQDDFTSTGEGGGELITKIPTTKLTAGASSNYLARLTKEIARITLSAHAFINENGYFAGVLPALRISAAGDTGHNGTLEKAIPHIHLTASAINGLIGRLTESIPSVELTASAHWAKGATVVVEIPALRINAHATSGTILAILMNAKNFALTEYTSYEYNSLGFFNGKMVGAKAAGIYELTGDDDDGENIDWSFKTGKLDMDDAKVKKARHVWLSYNPSGDLILTVDDGEKEYEYDVESVKQIDNAVRVKLGKGIRNRYLQFSLKNVANEKINLDRMRIFAEPTGKKR